MKVLVVGGSGFVGRALTSRLMEATGWAPRRSLEETAAAIAAGP